MLPLLTGPLTVAGAALALTPAFSAPTRIDNPYLPLSKFSRCALSGTEGGSPVRVIRRRLGRTEPFDHLGRTVRTIVIRDSEFEDGSLVERTLDYVAQADDGTVHYFGEDVNEYEDGRLVGHGGAWRFGRDTDTLGVLMPGRPRVGDRWRAEDVPGITVESDLLTRRIRSAVVHGRRYRNIIRVRERAEPDATREFKLYARGVGVIRELPADGRVDLVRCSR